MKLFSLLLTLLFIGTRPIYAERGVPFDLDTCVGEAKAIVLGELDASGRIKVTKIIRAAPELSDSLQTSTGQYTFKELQTLTGKQGPFGVVAFLNEKNADEWRLVLQYAGIIAFEGDSVYLTQDGLMNCQFVKSTLLTKDGFLHALDASIKNNDERLRLAALPHSPERARELVSFVLQHEQYDEQKDQFHHEVHFQLLQVASALKNPTAEEQTIVLAALRETKTVREQVILLNLTEWIPLTSDAMDAIAPFLPRENPPQVREAAMDALHRINGYKAVDYLAPYVIPNDPQFLNALEDFGSLSYPPQDGRLNFKAVATLKKAAEMMDGVDHIPIDNGYVEGAVSSQLCHYLCPALLPNLWRFCFNGKVSSAQPFVYLQEATGLHYAHEDQASWEAWWKKAQPLLEGDMNLQTAGGRALWMDRYTQADPATQKILMNLWFFEPTVDEAALVDAAMQKDGAKYVLSELWQRHRLSADTKKSIVQRFMTFKLVNQPPEGADKDKTLYGVSVESFMTFPFPMVAEFHNRMNIALGDRIPAFQDDSWNIYCMGYLRADKPTEKSNGVPMDSGQFSSPPQARAVVEYYESDFPHSHDILWKLRWELGPIRLSNEKSQ